MRKCFQIFLLPSNSLFTYVYVLISWRWASKKGSGYNADYFWFLYHLFSDSCFIHVLHTSKNLFCVAYTFSVLCIFCQKNPQYASCKLLFTTCYQDLDCAASGAGSWLKHACSSEEKSIIMLSALNWHTPLIIRSIQIETTGSPNHFLLLIITYKGRGNIHWPTYLLKYKLYNSWVLLWSRGLSFTAY